MISIAINGKRQTGKTTIACLVRKILISLGFKNIEHIRTDGSESSRQNIEKVFESVSKNFLVYKSHDFSPLQRSYIYVNRTKAIDVPTSETLKVFIDISSEVIPTGKLEYLAHMLQSMLTAEGNQCVLKTSVNIDEVSKTYAIDENIIIKIIESNTLWHRNTT